MKCVPKTKSGEKAVVKYMLDENKIARKKNMMVTMLPLDRRHYRPTDLNRMIKNF